jgi:hypothetical protein
MWVPTVSQTRKATSGRLIDLATKTHRGQKERGTCTKGFSRNLGGPDHSISTGDRKRRAGIEAIQIADGRRGPPAWKDRHVSVGMVSPNEGNEVRREDGQEVGASHSTDETGEPA